MRTVIEIPTSGDRLITAVRLCYAGDMGAAIRDDFRRLHDSIAKGAIRAGLHYLGDTNLGAEWAGAPADIRLALVRVPTWASFS